jgi:hypothetical protein
MDENMLNSVEARTEKFITDRAIAEAYRMRSVKGGYPGDWVERRESVINGKRFEFSRIKWGDGSVTVRAHKAGTTIVLHEWESAA